MSSTSSPSALQVLLTAIQTEHDKLAALTPAADVKTDFDLYVSNEASIVASYKQAVAKAQTHDTNGVNQALSQTNTPGRAIQGAARRLGWSVCLQT